MLQKKSRKMWSNSNNLPTIYYFESSMREIMLSFFADFKLKEILVIAQIRCNIANQLISSFLMTIIF